MGRLAFAAASATVLTVLLAKHGFTSAPVARIKALQVPAAPIAAEVVVPMPATDDGPVLLPPIALIWHVRNASPAPAIFELDIDGDPVCRQSVNARTERRLDCT